MLSADGVGKSVADDLDQLCFRQSHLLCIQNQFLCHRAGIRRVIRTDGDRHAGVQQGEEWVCLKTGGSSRVNISGRTHGTENLMFLQIFHEFRMFRRPTAVIDSLNIELQQGIPDVVRTAVLSGMSGKEQPHFLCLPIALQMLVHGGPFSSQSIPSPATISR